MSFQDGSKNPRDIYRCVVLILFFFPLSEFKKAMFMLKDRFLKHMEITGSTWLIETLHSAWNLKFSMESLDLLLLKE